MGVSPAVQASTARSGDAGIDLVHLAETLPAGRLVLGAGAEVFWTENFLRADDAHQHQGYRAVAAYTPLPGLELSGSWAIVVDRNDRARPQHTRTRGDPRLHLKAAGFAAGPLRLGAIGSFAVPTGESGGPALGATSITGLATVSWRPAANLVAAANLGYRWDRSDELFEHELSAMQRYAAGVARRDAALAALAAAFVWRSDAGVVCSPFLEGTVELPVGGEAEPPARLGAGVGLGLPILAGAEIVGALEARLSGSPRAQTDLPGLPPWQLYFAVRTHFDVGQREGCEHAGCPDGLQCREGVCTRIVTEPRAATFRIEGMVMDQDSNQGVDDASVQIDGHGETLIRPDGDGRFITWPLPTGEGLLRLLVKAPGYHEASLVVPRAATGEVLNVKVMMRALAKSVPGLVRGSLRDGRTGRPLRGRLTIAETGNALNSGEDGAFAFEIQSGRYQLLVSARGYTSQTWQLRVRPGETVIMNLDLQPNR